MTAKYLSLFSGIGGLEHSSISPLLFCEQDAACRTVLTKRHPTVPIWKDIRTLYDPPRADVIVGGWPCQDISSAGRLAGIHGRRSGLFFEMLRVAQAARATTIIGENVPNLLFINGGRDFALILDVLTQAGFSYVAWRVLNARAFGLPQNRNRLFIVASTSRDQAVALHTKIFSTRAAPPNDVPCGFYWTGGKRSICFSRGYTPALKIGSTDNKGRAPVAVFYKGKVRKLTASEFLRLQGFVDLQTSTLGIRPSVVLRMAGNAVPPPIGSFVIESVFSRAPMAGVRSSFGVITFSGILEDSLPWAVDHPRFEPAANLGEFLEDRWNSSLSPQAAAGLIVRSVKSGHRMPRELFDVLFELARDPQPKIHPSRGDSFSMLRELENEIQQYVMGLPYIAGFSQDTSEPEVVAADD